jgi:hypothetical protein
VPQMVPPDFTVGARSWPNTLIGLVGAQGLEPWTR